MEQCISVRGLVEFLLRAGDLDNRIPPAGADDLLRGSQLHRRLQKEAGPQYRAEVPLWCRWEYPEEEQAVVVSGRADGIFQDGGLTVVDEIKSTWQRPERMEAPDPLHLAQAKCYAYMLTRDNDLSRVGVRMTYIHRETEEVRYFSFSFSAEEIAAFFADLMEAYRPWVVFSGEWRERRQASLKALAFPFEYRRGQRDLVENVYRTIVHRKKLFLNAPTGSGKTIATLFPALKAMGEEKAERVFYLTAKTAARAVAEDTFALLEAQCGLLAKRVTITARDRICVLEHAECNPDACPRAAGHYDRVNEALYELLTTGDALHREAIADCAARYGVCPYELSLDAALYADAILCDYNYVFDPHVVLRRFFGEGEEIPAIFLIDEAHNLVERGRDMYSAVLDRESINAFRKLIREVYPGLYKDLGKVNTELLELRRRLRAQEEARADAYGQEEAEETLRIPGVLFVEGREKLTWALQEAAQRMGQILESERRRDRRQFYQAETKKYSLDDEKREMHRLFLDFYFALQHVCLIDQMVDPDHYVVYAAEAGRGDLVLHYFCVDPSENLAACMERGVASVLFSATLLPVQYHKRMLGGTGEDYEVYAESSFDPARRGVFLLEDVTSKYTRRGPAEYRRIAEAIRAAACARPGNYMVFFPSYAFLREVHSYLEEEMLLRLLVQRPDMTEEERARFLAAFEVERREESLVGLCVLGGVFGEGIDLGGERLIGVLIVGTGIPQIGRERDILRAHFDRMGEGGYDVAYRFPGMNKVLQAAGRVIRTETDVGFVALLDERFLYGNYRRLFPREWQEITRSSSERIASDINRFWDSWR